MRGRGGWEMRRARPCASRPEQPFCHFLPFSIYAVFLFWLHVSIFCSSASFLFPIPPLLPFFSMLFASSSSSSASSSFLLYLIHILGPPSPDSCRAAPFVRQSNFLETTDSQHRKSAESLPRRTKRSVAMHVLVSSGNTFHAFSW